MKIDRHNPRHWALLAASGLSMVAGAALRPLVGKPTPKRITLYGHALNGNLAALLTHYRPELAGEIEFCYAGLDAAELAEVDADPTLPVRTLHMGNLADVVAIARSSIIITDRRAVTLEILKHLTNIPFVDVWHGMPYKGFTGKTFEYLAKYREVWVTGPQTGDIYVNKFEVPRKNIVSTGYARVDPLVTGSYDTDALKAKYGIEGSFDKIVLLAPTWKQDDANRSVIPFGVSADDFFETLDRIGRDNNTLIIFRAHLHVAEAESFKSYPNVRNMSNKKYPLIEEFLSFSDVVVTDWSSLAFDYLALKRPMVFLDVPAPFKDGFSVPPEHRFGAIAATFDEFTTALTHYLVDPAAFQVEHGDDMVATEEFLYGPNLDGHAADRQYERIAALLR